MFDFYSFFRENILKYIGLYAILEQVKNKFRITRRMKMLICYDKLWKLLIDKKMNRTELKNMAGISFNVLAKMGKGEPISMESLYKICKVLKCNIGDIMEFTDE